MNWPKPPVTSLLLCAKHGMMFCHGCNKVAAIGMKENAKCPRCKVYAIKAYPPVL